MISYILLLSLSGIFPMSGLYIAQKRDIELDYKRSYLTCFISLIAAFIILIAYAAYKMLIDDPGWGYAPVLIAEMLIMPFLFFILVAAVISAVVALFFRNPVKQKKTTGTLDDPDF